MRQPQAGDHYGPKRIGMDPIVLKKVRCNKYGEVTSVQAFSKLHLEHEAL